MTFTSFNFLIFFPVVIFIFNLIPQKAKSIFLLLASYFFYINLQPIYALLLIIVTLSTYFFAGSISKANSENKRYKLLVISIIAILLPLFFFKYYSVVNDIIESELKNFGFKFSLPYFSYMLPIGISFYTFMAIGYLIDIYNEKCEFENNIATTGLFLSFFPIILSGPIERAGNIFPQLKNLRNSEYEDLVAGAKMMLWGYFMKLCVADRLGIYIDDVYNNISNHNGTTLLLTSFLYPFQVYCDLGGYSLIAIGVARTMGIKINPNFNRPFFATSMSEFWRRWHMSLIQWMTDYIYTPISFLLRKWKIWGIITALMLTFFISGIWHAAALTFIVWGLLQGLYLSLEAATTKHRTSFEQKYKLNKNPFYILISCCIVFILFSFSQIYGRSSSIQQANIIIEKIFTQQTVNEIYLTGGLLFSILLMLIVFTNDIIEEYISEKFFFSNKNILVRWGGYYTVIFLIIFFAYFGSNQFIYFKY